MYIRVKDILDAAALTWTGADIGSFEVDKLDLTTQRVGNACEPCNYSFDFKF